MPHIKVLDGWRGISILCVLAGHMLPLGPKSWYMNETIAATGMALFFILSGFLIVSMLYWNENVVSFLIRRCCRILPLAWLFLIVVLTLNRAPLMAWVANFLFFANLPPFYLGFTNGHFWSLCVEVQFYAAIALIVGLLGRAGLIAVPVVCVAVTVARIITGHEITIVTWWCIDEILAGGCLALIVAWGVKFRFSPAVTLLAIPALIASCHPATGILNDFRPYIAAALIGSTLSSDGVLMRVLGSRLLAYLAEISYALYVVHPLTYAGWLGTGNVVVRYAKRALSFILTFAFAHLSTRHFEKYWIELGREVIAKRREVALS
jgi:peptidoglycan/LPS O-acetylase OafA/YrhL